MAQRRGSVEVSLAEAKARMGVSVDMGRTSRRGSTVNYEKGGTTLTGEQVENLEGGTVAIPVFTEEDRVRILRKIDFRLVPMLGCLYLIAFIDRGNSEYRSNTSFKRTTFGNRTDSYVQLEMLRSLASSRI